MISRHRLKQLGMLGMNRRNVEVIGCWNERKRYPLVDNKLKTKLLAEDYGMAVPKLIGIISHQFEVKHLRKRLGLTGQFVIKPAQGSGGKGILVIVSQGQGSLHQALGGRSVDSRCPAPRLQYSQWII